jgi:hypothetical protein
MLSCLHVITIVFIQPSRPIRTLYFASQSRFDSFYFLFSGQRGARRMSPATPSRQHPSVRQFELFLKKLHHKTWRQALDLIDLELSRIHATKRKPDKYLAELCRLVSYLRYPTDRTPKAYRPLLLSMINPPAVFKEKIRKM